MSAARPAPTGAKFGGSPNSGRSSPLTAPGSRKADELLKPKLSGATGQTSNSPTSSPTSSRSPGAVYQKHKPSVARNSPVGSPGRAGGAAGKGAGGVTGSDRTPPNGNTLHANRPAPLAPSADDEPFVPEEELDAPDLGQGDRLMMAKARRQRSPGVPSPLAAYGM